MVEPVEVIAHNWSLIHRIGRSTQLRAPQLMTSHVCARHTLEHEYHVS